MRHVRFRPGGFDFRLTERIIVGPDRRLDTTPTERLERELCLMDAHRLAIGYELTRRAQEGER